MNASRTAGGELIDLRSDTVTRPTSAIRQAMAEAPRRQGRVRGGSERQRASGAGRGAAASETGVSKIDFLNMDIELGGPTALAAFCPNTKPLLRGNRESGVAAPDYVGSPVMRV